MKVKKRLKVKLKVNLVIVLIQHGSTIHLPPEGIGSLKGQTSSQGNRP